MQRKEFVTNRQNKTGFYLLFSGRCRNIELFLRLWPHETDFVVDCTAFVTSTALLKDFRCSVCSARSAIQINIKKIQIDGAFGKISVTSQR